MLSQTLHFNGSAWTMKDGPIFKFLNEPLLQNLFYHVGQQYIHRDMFWEQSLADHYQRDQGDFSQQLMEQM